jgi:hypothetical protein
MSPMMMIPPTFSHRRQLLGRSRETVCEGGGEHSPHHLAGMGVSLV